jgi:hypothetical protein
MFSLPLFAKSRQSSPTAAAVSPVDRAIDAFLDTLSAQDIATIDYAAAYDAVRYARERAYTRPVDIWTVYHNALGWQ